MTLKEKIQFSLLGFVLVGGAVMIGKNAIRKGQITSEERRSLDDGSAANHAKSVKMAFENDGWWGTDEEGLRNTIRAIRSKEDFRAVMTSYERLYNSSLLRDMKSELQSGEYNEMMAIIAAKPDRYNPQAKGQTTLTQVHFTAWARRLKAAFDAGYGPFPGTDEDAIKAVFMEIPSQRAYLLVAAAYKAEYAEDLGKALKSELEFWEYGEMVKLIQQKPIG